MIGNGDPSKISKVAIVGEMYVDDTDGYYADITVQNTFVSFTNLNKGLERYITVDEVNGTFTIKIDGCYKFDGVASLKPSAGIILDFAVFMERAPAAAIKVEKIQTELSFKNNQDTNTFSGTGWIDLKKGDIVTVKGASDTVPVRIDIAHMNLSIARRGS